MPVFVVGMTSVTQYVENAHKFPHINNWVVRRSVQSLHFSFDLQFFTWSAFISHHELPIEKYTNTMN